MAVTIYHNPRCSKSRQTLALLKSRGLEPEIILYLEQPPDPTTLKHLVDLLGIRPAELLRRKEAAYAELDLAAKLDDDGAVIAAMVAHPLLIERPIVVQGKKACIGRPPERVLEIL